MMLNCLLLVHRHKILAVRYVSPTDDNRYQAQKMKTDSLFADIRGEVGHIVVAHVNTEGVKALLIRDRNRLNALIRSAYPSERAGPCSRETRGKRQAGGLSDVRLLAALRSPARGAPEPARRPQRTCCTWPAAGRRRPQGAGQAGGCLLPRAGGVM
jgi:hypothetical protein